MNNKHIQNENIINYLLVKGIRIDNRNFIRIDGLFESYPDMVIHYFWYKGEKEWKVIQTTLN